MSAIDALAPRPARARAFAAREATLAPVPRALIDASCRQVVLLWYASAVAWLLLGSLLALLASVKLHSPYVLGEVRWLTFGRVRPAHLATMIYGWGSMMGIGTTLWLQARLAKVRLPYRTALCVTCGYWNLAVLYGTWQVLAAGGTSIEWLEFPAVTAVPFALAFVVLFVTSLTMLAGRQASHVYVSQWYLFGAVFWFPVLYIVATLLIHAAPATGMVQGVANWWFAHNVLGLWLTPVGLASAYYVIPKILGRPVHSYYLSLLGFWSLALFYNWAGTHHLIGGPLPAWLVTVGIVGSIMMFVPVIAVAINHHLTMRGHFHALRRSPSLCFTVFSAMSYTVVSIQGSLTALRQLNRATHFTHYTIAHAHMGVYAFYTMAMFGAAYYILPRLTGRSWRWLWAIRLHFACAASGILLYVGGLSWGGWLQGRVLNDPEAPFLASVAVVLPYLQARSLAGILLTVGHVLFAAVVYDLLLRRVPAPSTP